jgi:hypothetical protein
MHQINRASGEHLFDGPAGPLLRGGASGLMKITVR